MALCELEWHGKIARLVLDDPSRLNALSDEMIAQINTALDELEPRAKVVIIAARGKAFCAGHDLKQMTAARKAQDGGAAYFADLFGRCANMMLRLQNLPQPVIAEVHGIATAAGCQLVATCDLAIAAENTRFGINGINIGLFCSTPIVALSRNISRKKSLEMALTGDFIGAKEAQEFGLLNKIVPADDLQEASLEMAQKIASKLSSAVKIGKRAFYEQTNMSTAEAYAHMGAVMCTNMLDEETEEGILAFIEKRKPNWPQD